MSVTPGGSLAAFAKLMAQKTAVASTKNLKDTMQIITDNNSNGAFDALSGVMQDMQQSAVNSLPFQLFLAEINAGTMESRVLLMKEVLELLKDPDVQTALGYLIDFFNSMVDAVTSIVAAIPEAADTITETGAAGTPEADESNFWSWFARRWAEETARRSGGSAF